MDDQLVKPAVSTGNRFLGMASLGRNELWRYAVVNMAIIFASVIISIFMVILAALWEGSIDPAGWSEMTMLLAGMIPFPFALGVLWLGIRFIHQRPFRTLITPFRRIRWTWVIISGTLWLVLGGLSDLTLSFLQPGNYSWSFELRRFIPYFLICIILVPIQTATEELVFRAYLPQGLSRLTPGVWLPMIVSPVVFGLLHGVNPEVDLYGMLLTMPFYIGIGALLMAVTLRSESLELAWGLHLANNLYAALLVTFPGSSLTSPALFTIQKYDAKLALLVFVITAAIYAAILTLLGLLRRRTMPETPTPTI